MNEIPEKLAGLAHAPVLLVATDYDGTLAPIVDDPSQAFPHREAIVALRNLAALPHTQVAVISGRALSDLAELSGAPEHVHLVGSHGSEFDPGFAANLNADQRNLRDSLADDLRSIAGSTVGLALENKPASVAFHYRNADESAAAAAVQAVLMGPARQPGVQVRTGKKVVELSVVPTDKGRALESLRNRFGATAAVFLGDDDTDEDAFATLSGPDLAVKVGAGATIATHRLDGPLEVARFLARLCEEREKWLLGGETEPIEHHSLLSDLRTVALVSPSASVSWFCAPRVDSSALFAELLGGANAGALRVRPADGGAPRSQGYEDDSLVLRTSFEGFTVTDYLDASQDRPQQRAGRSDLIRVVEGTGRVELEFAPRLDFGRVATRLVPRGEGIEVQGSVDRIVLYGEGVSWNIERTGIHQTARAVVDLDAARPLVLELRFGTADLNANVVSEAERRNGTLSFWRNWAERLELPELARDTVLRSALVTRGLVYGPSGAISAAATTSLPEHLGGTRNWDYRFCWLRDAALSAEALVRLASQREGMRFLDWVLGILDHLLHPDALRPLYTVSGAELGPEAEIAELAGYGGSRPVRVGNAAAQQIQLDVFGPIASLIFRLREAGAPLSQEHSRLMRKLVQAVQARWFEPDHGIWELRMHRRHHVHSKVMCWMCVDRAIRLWQSVRSETPAEWLQLRDAIAADVLAKGWSPRVGAYTAAYGIDDLDAASLWIGLSGLVPPTDERFVSTVDVIERELRNGPTVYRYHFEDGLPGQEGGFHLCTSWLIDALILIGRTAEARALFDALRELTGATGCLSEQFDPATGRALGNHPQAYSHLGLIHNALNLERAERGEIREP